MKVLLADTSHLFWSSFFATAGQDDPDAAFRTALERMSRLSDGFDARVACIDKGRSWRKDLAPTYKSNRPEKNAAAFDQLRRLLEQLAKDGWSIAGVEGSEGDDIIATLAAKAPPEWDVVVASGDSDLLALCVDGPGGVTVQSTNPNGGVYDEAAVKAKFGVTPAQLTDFKSLTGDASDNVKGCPGCGPVHAARLLNELGSLDVMLEHPEAITPVGIREKFISAKDQIILARKLVTIARDVPIKFEDAIRPPSPESEEQPSPTPAESDAEVPKDSAGKSSDAVTAPDVEKPSPPSTAMVSAATPEQPMVLDRADPRWMLGLEPKTVRMLQWYCDELHRSGLYRKFQNSAAILSVVLRGRALGLDMTTSLDVFSVIKGRPTMGAMAIVGLVLSSGKCEYFDPIESDSDTEATWECKRNGRPAKRLTYTIEDARKAGLLAPSQNGEPSNWVKRPRPMLRKQSGVELARLVFPDVVSNVYSPWEFGEDD